MDHYKITLTPLSPFVIGGHQIKGNHYVTLDYIPAPNLQGALARRILESHAQYDVQQQVRDRQRQYWIDDSIPAEGCEPQWVAWLELFSHMRFTDATPFDAKPFAPTVFGCKANQDHPVVDLLPMLYKARQEPEQMGVVPQCSVCGSRLERKSGWQWPQGKSFYRRTVTRVALDDYRHVSADGQLFSLQAGEPFADRRDSPLKFVAYVSVPSAIAKNRSLELRGEVVRVGKHLTVGFGRMQVEVEAVEPKLFPEQHLQQWQEVVRDASASFRINGKLPLPEQASVSDEIYLDLEDYHRSYTEWLQEVADAPESVKVTYAYTQQTLQRSFQPGKMERKETMERFLLPGAVFVVESEDRGALNRWLHKLHQEGISCAPHSSTVTISPALSTEGGN